MMRINQTLARTWIVLGPRYLPFADAAFRNPRRPQVRDIEIGTAGFSRI